MAMSSLMSKLIRREHETPELFAVKPPEGYEVCPECKGFPHGTDTTSFTSCTFCKGKGFVDWVEAILGVKEEAPLSAGAHNHNMHVHVGAGGGAGGGAGSVGITMVGGGGGVSGQMGHTSIGPGPNVVSIQGGPGVSITHSHSHVSSSQSGMCMSASSIDEPTIGIDIPYIKEELKDWIEEHIKNEVSKRVQDELMRRGVK